MPVLVTREAPDFSAAAVYPSGKIENFTLSDFKGKYVCLLFYPMDFSFVCPSEILAFNRKEEEFKKRHCILAGISTDTEYTHMAWVNTEPGKGGVGPIRFPLVADKTKNIARMYGVLFEHSIALRGLFLIDKDGIVRHELINDLPLGRCVDEALRILDALQFYEKHGDVCPANWHPGEAAMKPTPKGVADYLTNFCELDI